MQRILGEEQWSLNEPTLECLIGSFHEGAHSEDLNALAGAHRVQPGSRSNPKKAMSPVGTCLGQGQSARARVPRTWPRPTALQWNVARWKPAKGREQVLVLGSQQLLSGKDRQCPAMTDKNLNSQMKSGSGAGQPFSGLAGAQHSQV